MKLTENLDKYGHSMHLALQSIVKELFDIDMTTAEAQAVVNKMSLSDVLQLDTALENNDEAAVRRILDMEIQLEYSLPGRAAIKSVAGSRISPTMRASSTTTTSSTSTATGKATTPNNQSSSTIKSVAPGATDNDIDAEIATKQKEIDDLKKKAGIK